MALRPPAGYRCSNKAVPVRRKQSNALLTETPSYFRGRFFGAGSREAAGSARVMAARQTNAHHRQEAVEENRARCAPTQGKAKPQRMTRSRFESTFDLFEESFGASASSGTTRPLIEPQCA
jgi:hypothetical protein